MKPTNVVVDEMFPEGAGYMELDEVVFYLLNYYHCCFLIQFYYINGRNFHLYFNLLYSTANGRFIRNDCWCDIKRESSAWRFLQQYTALVPFELIHELKLVSFRFWWPVWWWWPLMNPGKPINCINVYSPFFFAGGRYQWWRGEKWGNTAIKTKNRVHYPVLFSSGRGSGSRGGRWRHF